MEQLTEIVVAVGGACAALVCVAKAFKWPWGVRAFDKAASAVKFVAKFIPKPRPASDEDDE